MIAFVLLRVLLILLLVAANAFFAAAEFSLVSVRDTLVVGQQLFLHYQSGEYVVEQTLPAEHLHRLAMLPDQAALFERLLAIFPVNDHSTPGAACNISQEDLFTGKQYAETKRRDLAEAIFAGPGFGVEQVKALVEALAEPVFSGTIAMLRCVDEQIVDARNPALVQGQHSAWSFAQIVPGEPRFRITRVDTERFRAQLAAWFNDLSEPRASEQASS